MKIKLYVHVFIYPSAELKDVWIAHCLETDIATQSAVGGGVEGALQAIEEAHDLTLAEVCQLALPDGEHRFLPTNSLAGPAPDEFWAQAINEATEELPHVETIFGSHPDFPFVFIPLVSRMPR